MAQAAGVASFPFLAALAARGDDAGFDKTLGTALRGSMLVVIPLTAYMMAVALPTLGFIFEGGRFSAEETILTAPLLQILLLSVPFWVVQQVIGRAFYARQNTLTPAIVGTVATLAALPVYPLAVKLWGAFGVAMLTTLCLFVYTLALSWFWIRKHGTGAFDGMGHLLLKGFLLVLPGTLLAFFRGLRASRPSAPLVPLPVRLSARSHAPRRHMRHSRGHLRRSLSPARQAVHA